MAKNICLMFVPLHLIRQTVLSAQQKELENDLQGVLYSQRIRKNVMFEYR